MGGRKASGAGLAATPPTLALHLGGGSGGAGQLCLCHCDSALSLAKGDAGDGLAWWSAAMMERTEWQVAVTWGGG